MTAPAPDLPPSTWTPERVERLEVLVASGATFEAAALAIGVTKNIILSIPQITRKPATDSPIGRKRVLGYALPVACER